jgi:hypothetical protein
MGWGKGGRRHLKWLAYGWGGVRCTGWSCLCCRTLCCGRGSEPITLHLVGVLAIFGVFQCCVGLLLRYRMGWGEWVGFAVLGHAMLNSRQDK